MILHILDNFFMGRTDANKPRLILHIALKLSVKVLLQRTQHDLNFVHKTKTNLSPVKIIDRPVFDRKLAKNDQKLQKLYFLVKEERGSQGSVI